MKIPLNWLKKYVDIPVSDEELVRLIGARLVEVEGVIDETHKYDNIFIARVEKCEKIPDTHLTLCQINVGSNDLVQVVCGAPNVRAGMMAVWIAPGAIVPASVHEDAPFVIGKRKMQGYESNGMLAGADELDFGEDHSGIVEIDPEAAQPGDKLADVFELNDLILDIENKSLTHRPDCFGIIGFAREVAGILGQKFEEPEFLFYESVFPKKSLVSTKDGIKKKDSELKIEIADSKICPRYTGAVLKVVDATMQERYLSEMQVLLFKSGMSTNSKIVDVTNYIMLLTGQPLHAFDYDKFIAVGGGKTPEINVRLARKDEKIILLDDKEVELVENDIVICSGDVPVALAGAMGGKSTMIDENTKNIILESASFSLYNLRKTQMVHGIFSEAITRFTKGVPVGGTFNVLAEAVKEMNVKPLDLYDKYLDDGDPKAVKVVIDDINELLGTNYDKNEIIQTLENVSFEVKQRGKEIEVSAPYWRTDIHIKEDIIEEIGRLLGYDNIEPTLPLHATAELNGLWELKREVRNILARFGANEILTYSFVSGRLLDKAGQDVKNSYKIVNSISPELQYVRQSLVPSLLEKTYLNEKLPVEKFAIFEMNKVYRKEWGMDNEGVPVEKMQLGLVVAERKNRETAFYKAKLYVAKLLNELNIVAEYLPLKNQTAESKPFEPKRTAEIWVNGEYIGVVGEFKNSVRHEFKLADYLAGFEINMDLVMKHLSRKQHIKFGVKKKEDVTITTDKTYAEILKELQDKYPEAMITPGVIYQAPGQRTRNLTFHLEF
ncbi:phenylalanine--tRNA ligase subunit beta [Candidatus Saccharibacteria bacterium]|nr:phenylalanine--tRNA ligase subunit beta [Candidatus Saccharibacteria bacterium]